MDDEMGDHRFAGGILDSQSQGADDEADDVSHKVNTWI